MAEAYHTALASGRVEPAPAVERFEFRGSLAFVHDLLADRITDPAPAEFAPVEVFYADPPWPAGFREFERRAGVAEGRAYAQFMRRLDGLVRAEGRPIVLVAGKLALKHLPRPDNVYATALNGAGVLAICYRVKLRSITNARTILAELADRFGVGGDFCCGYGRTARAFLAAGKTFVVSDYNPRCIGHIAAHAESWAPC